jgi:phosphomethylpyrimidine synthase
VRDYAATLKDPTVNPHPEERSVSKDEAERGMAEMSEKFHALGDQVYVDAEKVKESNKAL